MEALALFEDDDVILPESDQFIARVRDVKKLGNIITSCTITTTNGKSYEIPLSEQFKFFLQDIRPGNYVLAQCDCPDEEEIRKLEMQFKKQKHNSEQEIEIPFIAKVVRLLDFDTISCYVKEGIWPSEFDPLDQKIKNKSKKVPFWKLDLRKIDLNDKDEHIYEPCKVEKKKFDFTPAKDSSEESIMDGEPEPWPPVWLMDQAVRPGNHFACECEPWQKKESRR